MANFLKSLFFGETDESEETKLNRQFRCIEIRWYQSIEDR